MNIKKWRILAQCFTVLALIILSFIGFYPQHYQILFACALPPFSISFIIKRTFWRCPSCNKALPFRANLKLAECPHCRSDLAKPLHTEVLKHTKSEETIMKEFDAMMTKMLYFGFILFFTLTFLGLLTLLIPIFKWLAITAFIIIMLYGFYFIITQRRCPNCRTHLIRHDFHLKKCPYCHVRWRK